MSGRAAEVDDPTLDATSPRPGGPDMGDGVDGGGGGGCVLEVKVLNSVRPSLLLLLPPALR
jgi:hypothetical protein